MKKRKIIMLGCIVVFIISFTAYLFIFIDKETIINNKSHFNVNEYPNIKYTFENADGVDIYAIVSVGDDEYTSDFLYYRLAFDDYLYLYEIGPSQNLDSNHNYIYQNPKTKENKLYVQRFSSNIKEYTLNKEKTKEKELNFDVKGLSKAETSSLKYNAIKKVEEDNIYLDATIYNDTKNSTGKYTTRKMALKCSLKDYTCEEDITEN